MKFRLRLEYGVSVALASALCLVWKLGEESGQQVRLAAGDSPLPMNGTAVICLLVAIVTLNALFVAAETAVDLLRAIHVRHVKEQNRQLSERLQDLVDNKPTYATACTLASRIARVAIGLLVVLIAASIGLVHRDGETATLDVDRFLINLALIAIPVALFNLVVGELVPKSFASLHPHKTGLRLYGLIRGASFVFSIPAAALVGVANLVTRRFGGRASFTMPNQAEEEILTIVESAQEAGEIEVDQKELLTSVFEFTHTVAREVMTPRVDLDAMSVGSSAEDLAKVMRESGHSRIPLYEETDDQIVGIVHAKDLLMSMVDGAESVDIRKLMRTPVFVPEGKELHELLRELRASRSQIAVVQDEFGGTAGIVTTEDIVEELVGDIVDEYDVDEPHPVAEDMDGYLVDGKTHLDDVNDKIGSSFDSEEFDTIGGFVFGLFGRQPKQGDEIDVDGFRFTIMETDGRRILRLRVARAMPLDSTLVED